MWVVLRRFLRFKFFVLEFLLAFFSAYFFIALFGMFFHINDKSSDGDYEIFMKSDGIHTDFILPVRSEVIHWDQYFPVSQTKDGYNEKQYLAVGWGDQGFFLNTPQWSDLTAKTAVEAVFYLGKSALHINYLDQSEFPKNIVSFRLKREAYLKLVSYIKETVIKDNQQQPIWIPGEGYWQTDSFYEAHDTYGLFNTCNSWVNKGLKHIEQPACLWTPFNPAIFRLYRD
jgi:uncharacterized protein (TIGR02117 family)